MARSQSSINTVYKGISKLARLLPRRYRIAFILITVCIALVCIYALPYNAPVERNDNQSMPQTLPNGNYRVVKVSDGDTFKVESENREFTIRLIGVDTPEVVDPRKPVQCFGVEASNKLKSLLIGEVVRLERDITQDDLDAYGRLLRYVYLSNGTNVNLTLIELGFAHEYTFRVPYQQQLQFKAAELEARNTEKGLWNPNECPSS